MYQKMEKEWQRVWKVSEIIWSYDANAASSDMIFLIKN